MTVTEASAVPLPPGADDEYNDEWQPTQQDGHTAYRCISSKPFETENDIRAMAVQFDDGSIATDNGDEPAVYFGSSDFHPEDARVLARALMAAADLADTWTKAPIEYDPNRYVRLRKCAKLLADDPQAWTDDMFVTPEMLMAFVDGLIGDKFLDGLSEYDANTVALIVTLDFYKGPLRQAERIVEWLNDETCGREDENPWAVMSALTAALKGTLDAFAYAAGEEASDS